MKGARVPYYMTERALLRHLRREVAKADTQNAFADAHDLDRGYFSKIVRGLVPLTPYVAATLGYEQRKVYVKIVAGADERDSHG